MTLDIFLFLFLIYRLNRLKSCLLPPISISTFSIFYFLWLRVVIKKQTNTIRQRQQILFLREFFGSLSVPFWLFHRRLSLWLYSWSRYGEIYTILYGDRREGWCTHTKECVLDALNWGQYPETFRFFKDAFPKWEQ